MQRKEDPGVAAASQRLVGRFPEVCLSVAGDRDRPVSLRLPADRFALSLVVEHRVRAWRIRDPVCRPRQLSEAATRQHTTAVPRPIRRLRPAHTDDSDVRHRRLDLLVGAVRGEQRVQTRRHVTADPDRAHRVRADLAHRHDTCERWPTGHARGDDDLRLCRRHRPIPPRTGPRVARHAEPPRKAVLPGRVPAADDDHASRHWVPVPHDDGHAARAGRTAVGRAGIGRLLLDTDGRRSARCGDHRRHLAVDTIHLHRTPGGVGGSAARTGRSGAGGWRQPVAGVPLRDRATAHPGEPDRDHDPHHRGLQDRRHAAGPHARWTRNSHRIGDAAGVQLVARPRSRGLSGDGLPVALRRDVHRASSLSTSSASAYWSVCNAKMVHAVESTRPLSGAEDRVLLPVDLLVDHRAVPVLLAVDDRLQAADRCQ